MLSPAELLEHALELPDEARAQLARRLLDTLTIPGDGDADAWVAEVERRAERFLAGGAPGIPADEVFGMAEKLLEDRGR